MLMTCTVESFGVGIAWGIAFSRGWLNVVRLIFSRRVSHAAKWDTAVSSIFKTSRCIFYSIYVWSWQYRQFRSTHYGSGIGGAALNMARLQYHQTP